MKQLEGFPESARGGERWQAYLGDSALLTPEVAAATGAEALWLFGLDESELDSCRLVKQFGDEGDNYWMSWWARTPIEDFSDSLTNHRGRFNWVLNRIPNILKLIDRLEVAAGAPVADFLINSLPANGAITSHTDTEPGVVTAVNLMGKGRVTIAEKDTRSWFYTKPGEAFSLHNLARTSQRPAHRIRAIGGPRVSIAM